MLTGFLAASVEMSEELVVAFCNTVLLQCSYGDTTKSFQTPPFR